MSKTKTIKSQDGKLEVKYDEVTHVCVCVVIYALLHYLLLADERDARDHTIYYCYNKGIDKNIRDHLPSITLPNSTGGLLKRVFWKILWKWQCVIQYPFLKTAEIFAQDHIPMAAILIGDNHYSLLSDGPNCFSRDYKAESVLFKMRKKKNNSFYGKVEKHILGDVCVNNMGGNPHCDMIYLTEENTSPLLENHHVDIQSLNDLWEKSSPQKKKFILEVFNCSGEDIDLLNGKSICFLSQPLVNDRILTEGEYHDLLERVFQKYDINQLIIKTHPRDTFDYKKHFPQIALFDKPIGTQLLAILGGTNMRKVVTISSSAIEAFPVSVEADVFGTEIHPKIEAGFGSTYTFSRVFNKVSL